MWGMKAYVVAVLPVNTDPKPGVSTRHMPADSIGLGTNTSTPFTPFVFSGLCFSETYCARSEGKISCQEPSRDYIRALRSTPNRITVGNVVMGMKPTGRMGSPIRALISGDLPRLNLPMQAT